MKGVLVVIVCFIVLQLHLKAEKNSLVPQTELKYERVEKAFKKEGIPIPIYMSFKENDLPSIDNFWEEFKRNFNVSKNFSFVKEREEKDHLGFQHLFFRQTYRGNKIFPAQLHLKVKHNRVESFSGKAYSEVEPRLPELSEEAALKIALNDIGALKYKWDIKQEESYLKQVNSNPTSTYFPKGELIFFGRGASANQSDLRLCFRFNIYAHSPLGRFNYYIDAVTGDIVFIENLLHNSDAQGQATTAYSGVKNLTTDSIGNYYRLRESGRGNGIETYDLNNSTTYSSAVDFIDSNNIWDTFNPPIDQYATDAHWGTEQTYDYFLNVHNRNSIDNLGFTLRSFIHYGTNYANAFWDGQRMTYGDGSSTINPLTTLDITGHEITHGLTNFTSQLVYAKESGALNESFSDIFGVAVDHFARSNAWNWLLGDELGGAFRSMANPNQYGDPDTYGGLNWVSQNCTPTNGNDWCGVHTNSGVQNYWFYLISEGGSGTNDIGNQFKVDSIGILKSSKIAFRNNTIYLTSSSDFEEARFFSIVSAADLYGACSPEVEAVTNAWYAVGVGKPYQSGVAADFDAIKDTAYCQLPATVEFKAEANNVLTYFWDFGDGTTSSLINPTHTYLAYGEYDVQLIADGGSCGSDTLNYVNYINVDSTNLCASALTKSYTIFNDCNGVFHDRGGLNGSYDIDTYDTILIQPDRADLVKLFFNKFSVESGFKNNCNHDFLEIFDGSTTDDLSLGRFCSANLPPDSILSSGKSILLVFHSDSKVTESGFSLRWQCEKSSSLPQVDFATRSDSSCNGKIMFNNLSSNGSLEYLWLFGDGDSSSSKNPTHFYSQNGVYTVKLIVENSFGKDSIIKQNRVFINRGSIPSVRSDTVCKNDDAKIWASGIPDLLWFNGPKSERVFFTGDTLLLNNLTNTQEYYVSSSPVVTSQIVTPFNIMGNGYFSDTSEAIYFNVYEPIVIEAIVLKSNKTAERNFIIKDSSGQIIESKSVNVSGSTIQVKIQMEVYPGNNYSLTIGSREPSLYVNSSGANYPYSINGLIDITGSSLGNSAFPFFYYMEVKPIRCQSSRVQVEAFVDTSCVLTKNVELPLIESNITLYPNPVSEQLNVSGLERQLEAINIFASNGKLLRQIVNSISGNFKSEITINTSSLTLGVYFLELRFTDGSTKRTKFIKMNP